MTSLCHPSVMVSLAESSPKYSMLKMIPVLVHNPSSGSFQVTSSPRRSLRRQSFLRSFAMSYVWRRLPRCSVSEGLADRLGLPNGVDQYPNVESVDSLRRVGKLPLAEIIDPLGVLFRFKMDLYSMHEMSLARNFKGSPHDRALPRGRLAASSSTGCTHPHDPSRRIPGQPQQAPARIGDPFGPGQTTGGREEALKVLCRKACWYIRPEGGEGPSFYRLGPRPGLGLPPE